MTLMVCSTTCSPLNPLPRWMGLACCLGAVFISTTSAEDATVRRRFQEEYRPRAQALMDYYGSVEVKYTTTTVGGENTIIQDIKGKCDLRHFLLTGSYRAVKNGSGETYANSDSKIEGRNPRYSFNLSPKAEGRFKVQNVTLSKDGETPFMCCINAPYADSIRGITFLEMGDDKGTNFLSLEDRQWQNETMKALRAEYVDSLKNPLTIEYYFSPQNAWLCRGLRRWVTDAPDVYTEEIYSYEPGTGEPFPPLKKIEVWSQNAKDPTKSQRTSVTEITEFRHAGLFNEADFHLSAFGLPEPAPAPPPSWPLWLMYTLGAVGLGAAAVLFAWLRRRFQKKSPSPG